MSLLFLALLLGLGQLGQGEQTHDHLNLLIHEGNALQAQGDAEQALLRFDEAARLSPQSYELLTAAGGLLYRLGRFPEAADRYRAAARLQPALADAHFNLGVALYHDGRLELARRRFKRAAEADPRHVGALFNLGVTLSQLGLDRRAIRPLRAALRADPAHAAARAALGRAHFALREFAEAREAHEAALAQRADDVEALVGLGLVHMKTKGLPRAVALFEQALAVAPGHPAAGLNLGAALFSSRRYPEAVRALRRAVAVAPADTPADELSELYANLGMALGYTNEPAAAAEAFAAAVRALPTSGAARYRLSNALRAAGDSAGAAEAAALAVPALRAELADTQQLAQRKDLLFHLFDVCDKLGDYACATDALQRANRARAELVPSNARRLIAEMENEERFWTSLDRLGLPRPADQDQPQPQPLFVVGMPRSGTTLLEQMLGMHPQVAAAGEVRLLSDIAQRLFASEPGLPHYAAALRSGAQAAELRGEYAAALRRATGDSARPVAVVKMPWDFLYLGLVRALWPEAPVVHIVRDARDAALSIHGNDFVHVAGFESSLADVLDVHAAHLRLMRHWAAVGVGALRVDYEALVAAPRETLAAVLEHARLPWDDAVLRFHESKEVALTASWTQVREPVYQRSVGRWRSYASLFD